MLTTEYVFRGHELIEVPVRKQVRYARYLEKENDYLKANYHEKTIKKLAHDLARTVRSVEAQVIKLGLVKTPNWKPEEVSFLINNHKQYTTAQLAERFNRTENAVKIKKTRLGLCKRTKNTPVI